MSGGKLHIDLDAVAGNWQALDTKSKGTVETAAVVKANGYGLGADKVAARLAREGVKSFFVAIAEEAVPVRKVAPNADIFVFSGYMAGDAELIQENGLIPLLNSSEQVQRFQSDMGSAPFGMQLDSGMNRLGIEPNDFVALKDLATKAKLVMSHLACADEPEHEMNAQQLSVFRQMTDGLSVRRSLAATGGILLGQEYHFDLTRPGVGLYGGLPFEEASPVIKLSVPVIQTRDLAVGESVGYGNSWVAERPTKVATIASGYADGLHRRLGFGAFQAFAGDVACPVIGRVSMDLITVDVTDLLESPEHLELINKVQTVDQMAEISGTIGYEILTSLGQRYDRNYTN